MRKLLTEFLRSEGLKMNEQRELHDSVVAWASRINESWQGTVRNIVETGKALIDAKADLPHGAFTEMVETDLLFSTRTAQRLMAIAEHPSLSNPTHVSVLPASWGTLYELSKIDGCTVEKLIQAGRIYPELERKDISALLPPPKTKAKAKKATPSARRADPAPVEPVTVVEPKAVDIIEPVEEAPEVEHVEYTLIRPDVSTPIVHVDSPAPSDDILVDHLRNELAAAAEENEQLKAVISDLKAKAVVAENEIAGLMACRARLEDRVRELEAEHPAEPADVPVDTWDERKLIFVNNIVEQFADGKQHSVGEITARLGITKKTTEEIVNEMIEASLGGAKVQRHKRGTGSMYSFQRIAEGQV